MSNKVTWEYPVGMLMDFARQDDCLDGMVPSDLRQIFGRLAKAEELAESRLHALRAIAAQIPKGGDDPLFNTEAEKLVLQAVSTT